MAEDTRIGWLPILYTRITNEAWRERYGKELRVVAPSTAWALGRDLLEVIDRTPGASDHIFRLRREAVAWGLAQGADRCVPVKVRYIEVEWENGLKTPLLRGLA